MAKATITAKTCKQCRGKHWVPQPSEIPQPLRKLNKKLIEALRPLDVDVGPHKQAGNGYRIHSAMVRFSWSELGVQAKIRELRKRRQREKAQAAYDYLMTEESESSYRDFVKKHNRFLRKFPEATDADRRRPLQFIETVGLECALWPSLYWCTEMCETTERATDSRRLAAAAAAGRNEALSDDEDDDQEGRERHSIKRSFMRKVLSPIIGYGQDFELLQFVYDLTMWSRIGGGKNACAGLPLRLVLKGETFSPLYWKTKHQALIDMQRQCGFPALFKTMAPWEYSFPYHVFVLDEMEKGGRGRMQLAGLETLHTAHVFTELNRGLYSGLNKTAAQDGWKDHILASTAAEEGNKTVVNYFQRLEFQDGKRKLPTQDYHGSGRVHVHSLDYLQNVEEIGLEHKMSATVPDAEEQPTLRGYMLGRPHGRSDSGWPVEGGESRYDREDKIVRLHHTEEDKASGHRAFFPETLEVTKCHQDVLHGNGQGLLLRYVATYTPKFSDSFAREWLNDEASAFSVARRVLFDYQPAEPEMWLYLCAQQMPPCRYGGTMVPLIVPWPGMETPPQVVKAYEDSEWRREDMSLLEFCRKTNKDGRIAQWVVKLHKAAGDVQPADDEATKLRKLHDFANSCPMSGDKLVACDMLSIFNDRWFGQWLALRQPFRCLGDLMLPEVQEKVPPQYVHFANAVLQCPEFWQDEERIRVDLEREAMGNAKIQTFLAKVLAQRALMEKFLSGELAKEDADGTQEALREVGLLPEEEDPMFKDVRFNERQERLEKSICKLLDRAKAAREAPNDAEYDHIVEEAKAQNRPQAVTGPPGTGKTTVVDKCVRRCLRQGGRVLYALPTAQQASRVRSRHPEADVDTCAGAFFLYKDSVEVMDCLTQYDMIAVDEISQLSQKDFERIIQMWEAADRVPVLVFAGDFWQLPGVQPTKATDSPKWHMVHQIELHEMWRCKDETLRQKLVALRTAMPTKELLKRICLRHKAWSGHRTPTAWDIQQLYRKVPHTTIATCTKKRAAHVNDLSIWVLFTTQRKRQLANLQVDWESNADNYDEENNVIAGRPPVPLTMKVYKNLRVHLTRNVDKSSDFVNGMEATVKSYDPNSRCLHVLTKTGRNLAVYPITDWVEGCGYVTAYPVRPGYASTVHKLQGAELEHITVWLDIPFMRAAGYVALSRVQRDTDYLLGGIVTRRHFVPAM